MIIEYWIVQPNFKLSKNKSLHQRVKEAYERKLFLETIVRSSAHVLQIGD